MALKIRGHAAIAVGGLLLFLAAGPPVARPACAGTEMTEQVAPCCCGCAHCGKHPWGHGGHAHEGRRMPPGMEKMRGHLEEMRKGVAGLRESEKKIEANAGSDPFRAAVLDHLKKLDDLQASHLEHMEGMMGHAQGGKEEARPEDGK